MGRRLGALAVALTAASLPARAHAAGLSRPNVDGARAIGLGGAFTAVADDPTAVWHNPAGPAFFGDNVAYLGGELLITQRSYQPSADSPLGRLGHTGKIGEDTSPTFVPLVGGSTRFGFGKTKPTRFALSVLAHLGYGGSISYPASSLLNPTNNNPSGIVSTQISDFEVTPALSYQVTDVVAIGAALRIGINSFSVNDYEPAFHATLGASGVGIGGTLGIMLRPHRMVDIGAVYRTPLSATLTGTGPVAQPGSTTNRDLSIGITWPQSAGVAVAIKPHRRVLATVQGDWTAWSSVQQLSLQLNGLPPQVRPFRYSDSYALHFGAQVIATRFLLLRAGYAVDSNAVPDSTVRRENIDSLKGTVSAGLGLHFWKLFIDAAFESLIPLGPSAREVKQSGTDNEGGAYEARVYSVELSAQIHF